MSKPKHKICTICAQAKPKNAFPRHENQVHYLEYCRDCQENQGDKVLLFNPSNFAIDMVSVPYADALLLAGFVRYIKGKYRLLDETSYLETIKGIYPTLQTTDFRLAIGKYDEKRKRIAAKKAEELVAEGHVYGKKIIYAMYMQEKNWHKWCLHAISIFAIIAIAQQTA